MNARSILLLTVAVTLAAIAMPAPADEEELIWKDGKWVRQPPPAEGTPAGELAIIRRDMDKKKYRRAVRHAKRFLKRYPSDPLREDACHLAGDAELRRGNYWQAYTWYERQMREFPNGDRMDRALERETEVAMAFLAGKKRKVGKLLPIPAQQDGIEILEKVAGRASGTPRAEIALLTIADHYFGKGKWAEAAACYGGFLKLYPKSPRAPHAELRSAESLRRGYRGSLYDETPLIEAEHRYKAFARNHPARARKAKVEEILRQIHCDRAAKQYEVGRFYLRTNRPESAAYYFQLVVSEYAETNWANLASGQLSKLVKGPAKKEKPPAGKKDKQADKESES